MAKASGIEIDSVEPLEALEAAFRPLVKDLAPAWNRPPGCAWRRTGSDHTGSRRCAAACRVSAVELAAAANARISRLNGKLNAFLTVTAEQAREEARQADAEWLPGATRSAPGIPVAVKDLF